MATKLDMYTALSERTVIELTERRGNWMRFLDTAARMYKYSFSDQLMIYAQRPNAVACAPIDTWNDTFHRWVRRGSKGIALIDDSYNKPRLKYVFDVADTEPSHIGSRPVRLWEMRQEHRAAVLAELAKSYEDIGDTLADSFRSIARELATEYYNDNARDIHFRAEDSYLEPHIAYDFAGSPIEGSDDGVLQASFIKALSDSVAYSLASRCNLDTAALFDDGDFLTVTDFNTPDMVYALGTATSDLAEQVLRDVEIVIKKYERLKNSVRENAHEATERSEESNERDQLHTKRGLSDPQHQPDTGGHGRHGDPRQVRDDAESLSQGAQADQLQPPAAERQAVPAPAGDRPGGDTEARSGDVGTDSAEQLARQGSRRDGVDSGDEHAAGISGGNGQDGADLQLEIAEILRGSAITPAEVDAILRDGGNGKHTTFRIVAHFAKGKDDNAAYLRREYLRGLYGRKEEASGKGFVFGGKQVAVWFDENGIHLRAGTTVRGMTAIVIPWEQAARRVEALMLSGEYVSRDTFDEALDNERSELASQLWNFYRDDMGQLPDEWQAEHGGAPDDEALIKSLLDDEHERGVILDKLEEDVADYENRAQGRPWHNRFELLADLRDAMLPPTIFPNNTFRYERDFQYFITEDEIDAYLTRGSSFSEGKFRVLSHFLQDHTPKERIDFLKEEYGHGGGTLSTINGWYNTEPGKGIQLARGTVGSPDAEVAISWAAAIKRISKLIDDGQYMTPDELSRIPRYEGFMLAQAVSNFYSGLSRDEYAHPFPDGLDFHYPHEAEYAALTDFLGDSERVDATLEQMRYIFENTPTEDSYYNLRKVGYERLAAFREGTYTLFPGLERLPEPGAVLPVSKRSARRRDQDLNTLNFGEPDESLGQISFFSSPPALPSVEEQQAKIEQAREQAGADAPAVSFPITQNEIDALLLVISDEDKARLTAQFAENPRSREAAQLVREIYGGIEESIPRLDGAAGYLWMMAENTGVTITGGEPYKNPKTPPAPAETITLAWSAVHKRVAELAAEGKLEIAAQLDEGEPDILQEIAEIKRENGGAIILWRVGDFYEAYGEDAITIAAALDISTTERHSGELPHGLLAGIPAHSLGDYLRKLSEAGYAAVVVDENEDRARTITRYDATPPTPLTEPDFVVPAEPTELDFNTVAQTILERVVADPDYAETLAGAANRASLRNACTMALEQSLTAHQQDEPEIFRRYFSDDDFSDDLFNYVLRHSWEIGQQALTQTEQEQAAAEPAEPEQADAQALVIPVSPACPPPAFVVDWEQAKNDFDLRLYRDHDVIAYDKDGVEHRLGRSGNLAYVTSTGAFWGTNEVPSDIYEQIQAYTRGDLSNEQVRENYLAAQDAFRDHIAADLDKANGDLVDVLENALLTGQARDSFTTMLARGAGNAEIAKTLALDFSREIDTLTLTTGETADYEVTPQSLSITILDKFNTKLAFPWTEIAPIVRALAVKWVAEQELAPEVVAEVIPAQPVAKKLYDELSPSGETTAYYLFHYPDGVDAEATLRYDDLSLIQEKADAYVLCAAACYISEDTLTENNITFCKLPRDWHLLPVEAQDKIRAIHPGYEGEANITYDHKRTQQTTIDTPPLAPRIPAVNYRITDDHLGEGGAKTKFRYNLDAINTLRDIELEGRSATPEEQEVLSRYVGWGGLPQAFDPDNKQWTDEYLELNATLTPEEWESARGSTLNAHYTTPTVIKAIYETVERMGFKTGNILEPSCGIGNFFGLLPDSMRGSKLYGVELDSVTARIAKALYPKAAIQHTGFEQTDFPDSFFDLAIGNVPFGNYSVPDRRYKQNFHIHDYFFQKTLDKVRPGGVIAFVTSKYTLDKQNPAVRKYIAQRAELLGAVRLPNNAFLKNAGTETTMDILFLQKRDRPVDIEPEWVHLGRTEDGLPLNRYYLDNPEMVLGKMGLDKHLNDKYGRDDATACLPIEGADLAEQLKAALSLIQGQFAVEELDDLDGVDDHAIPADPSVKNFSYALVTPTTEPDNVDGRIYAAEIGKGRVYFRENSLMYPVDLPATTLERIKGMVALRDCVHRLIALQLDDYSDAEIKAQQEELNSLYDAFTAEYGLISSTANSRAFNADSSYYLLSSLEILDEEGNLERKADMFSKRTIKQKVVITHVDTASEALAVSIGEKARVDLPYMASLTGMSEEQLYTELKGVIFLNIGSADSPEKAYVTADEYLSGNVRKKLESAKAAALVDPMLEINVRALEAAQPVDLEASEIAVRLGATWIAPQYMEQFMYELLDTSPRNRDIYKVRYHEYTGEWQITGKGKAQYSDVAATVTYGTNRMNAYEILCDTLNLRDVRVYDYKYDADGKQVRELNKKETTLAQQKQELIKQAFKDWLWKDPERRQTLVKLYNEQFNSVRPREYDGSHITFGGISPEIVMRPHQLNAVAHHLYGGNILLAHVVGAGKTFEMAAIAMEAKRLGLCHKSLIAVPNHLPGDIAADFLRLYPSANILVATKKDFEMRNRKKFCAKIATGDYDAVIIGHSQLEKIPMSRERQERLINEQLSEIEEGIDDLKRNNGENFSIKQLEKTRKTLEARLKKLLEAKTRDDVVTFEQLGVDRLIVDEAHNFKNLFLYTKMRNVAGLSTSEAQKSSDLFMKCRYMDELTGNRGVVFATGTPISNSMTEMYTMQRYLQYDTLVKNRLTHFDCWASIFGETVTSIELAPEGNGYRARTRFARFHNLPEVLCFRGSLKKLY